MAGLDDLISQVGKKGGVKRGITTGGLDGLLEQVGKKGGVKKGYYTAPTGHDFLDTGWTSDQEKQRLEQTHREKVEASMPKAAQQSQRNIFLDTIANIGKQVQEYTDQDKKGVGAGDVASVAPRAVWDMILKPFVDTSKDVASGAYKSARGSITGDQKLVEEGNQQNPFRRGGEQIGIGTRKKLKGDQSGDADILKGTGTIAGSALDLAIVGSLPKLAVRAGEGVLKAAAKTAAEGAVLGGTSGAAETFKTGSREGLLESIGVGTLTGGLLGAGLGAGSAGISRGISRIRPSERVPMEEPGNVSELVPANSRPVPQLFHGSDGGNLKMDSNGNINLGAAAGDVQQFGSPITVKTQNLNVENVGTKEQLFNIAASPELKQDYLDNGVDVIGADGQFIAINPEKLSLESGLSLRDPKLATVGDLADQPTAIPRDVPGIAPTQAAIESQVPLKTVARNIDDVVSYEGAPDKARVKKYREDIRSSASIEPIVIRKDSKGVLGIEDGKHRYQAYKEEGITQIPTVDYKEPVKPSPKAEPEKPKIDPKKASRVFARLKADNPELKGDTSYEAINLKEDAEKAVSLVEKDKDKAYRIAMGAEESKGTTSTSVNIALAEKALDEGKHVLYAQLVKKRSLDQTRRGQEIVAEKGSVTDNSTARYVKELISARLEKLGKEYLSDVNLGLKKASNKMRATAKIDKEVKQAMTKLDSKEMDLKSAQALIDSLAC